jgi:CDGSH-type Zn-finger protein
MEPPTIFVTEHGPYRVEGEVAIHDAEGTLVRHGGTWCLCRCGGSRNKPFCDVTHGVKGFDGTETADHGSIVDRRDTYVADRITVFDDRSRCAHLGNAPTGCPRSSAPTSNRSSTSTALHRMRSPLSSPAALPGS